MGLYFLYFLFFILAPLGYGVGLAVLLRELHLRQQGGAAPVEEVLAEPEIAEPETPSEPEEPEAESPPEEVSSEEVSPEEMSSEKDFSKNSESEPEPESRPSSIFDDQGLLPKNFKADEVIDNMLDEERPETSEDLTSRLEETVLSENQTAEFGDDSDDDPFGFEDDVLARAMEHSGVEMADNIDFDEEFAGEDNDAISTTAREILGEEFDFDSLMPQETPEMQEEPPPEVIVRELEDGVIQADAIPATQGPPPPELLAEEQRIESVFPDEMVSNAVAEPEQSEAARRHSFVEESRPMFVRRKSKGVKE